jgi:hypothetical protein
MLSTGLFCAEFRVSLDRHERFAARGAGSHRQMPVKRVRRDLLLKGSRAAGYARTGLRAAGLEGWFAL